MAHGFLFPIDRHGPLQARVVVNATSTLPGFIGFWRTGLVDKDT